jgi:tetratricopeptide (TPR) repeat protein
MRRVLTLFLLAFTCVGVSCHRDPKVALQRYLVAGDKYFNQRHYNEAAIEYANAVNVAPMSGQARAKLAASYLAVGNTRLAFPQYIRAADLLPDDLDVQFEAGFLLFKGGLFAEAKSRARTILEKKPDDPRALLLLANCLAGLKDSDDAIDVLSRIITIDPEAAGVYTNLGVLQLSKGERDAAQVAFTQALAASHNSVDALVGLGNFYRVVGDRSAAEQTLKRALAAEPNNMSVNVTLASLYVEWNRLADAEACLKKIAAMTKDPRSVEALASFYTSVGRSADAIQILQGLAADPTQYLVAENQIALIQLFSGRLGMADKTVAAVLARDPRNAPGLTTKARIELAAGRTDTALDTVHAALLVEPRFPAANLTLGRILIAQGNVEEARKAFNLALDVDPTSLPAELELIDLHRRRGEIDTAIQFADQAVRTHPASIAARLARVKTWLVRQDDRHLADAELKTLVAKYPTSAAVDGMLGQYYLSVDDSAAARRAFQQALDVNPLSMEALTGLVAIDVAAARPQDARARVDAALAKNPNAPGPLLLAAKVYVGTGNSAKAEELLKRLLQVAPSDVEPYALLARIYVSERRLDDAKKQFVEMARLDPRSIGPPTMLGVLCYVARDVAGARTWWQQALRIDPRAAAAANNLAWLYAENNGDLDVALELAQSARTQWPNEPEVNDTLGWIYYKKKMTGMAVQYLSESAEVDQKNAMFQFHLGMAYAQAGDDAKARRTLQKALSLDPTFDGAVEARKTLARLVY